MSSLTPEQVHLRSLELMYNSSHVVGIIPQSMVYGELPPFSYQTIVLMIVACRRILHSNMHILVADTVRRRIVFLRSLFTKLA